MVIFMYDKTTSPQAGMLASAHLTLKTNPDCNTARRVGKPLFVCVPHHPSPCACVRVERSINEHVSRAEFRVIKAVVKKGTAGIMDSL